MTLGTAALALALAGCSVSEAGTPSPADTHEPTPTTSAEPPTTSADAAGTDLPSHGAPRVENPIDTTEFERHPCRMLTDEQVRQAGLVPPGKPGEGAVAPACSWRNRDSGAYLNIQFENATRRGLSAAYAANEADRYDLWLELEPVNGFPVVAADILDLRDGGECPIVVGTSDEVTFGLGVRLSKPKRGEIDPCSAAVEVAALALQTMGASR